MFAHMLRLIIQNHFHLLLKYFSIRNSLSDVPSAPLFVDAVSIFVACAVEFQIGVLAPEDFSVSNLPLRGLTIRRSRVCCSVCMRNGLRFIDSKHCFADDEKTALHEYFGHWWEIPFSRKLPRNKNAPWRQTTVWRHGGHHRICTSRADKGWAVKRARPSKKVWCGGLGLCLEMSLVSLVVDFGQGLQCRLLIRHCRCHLIMAAWFVFLRFFLVPLCWYAVSERQMLLFFAGSLVGVDKHLVQRVSLI